MPQVPINPTGITSVTTATRRASGRALLLPPEERFWKRYSPHHEFSLSGATSLALHILALGLILLLVWLWWGQTVPPTDVPLMEAVSLEDRTPGGGPNGVGAPDKKGDPNKPPDEAVEDPDRNDDRNAKPAIGAKVLEDPPVAIPDAKDGRRVIVRGDGAAVLKEVGRRAQRVLAERQGTRGNGGGDKDENSGDGKGSREAKIRRARQLRWRVVFNNHGSGPDYLDKLYALGATLVVAETKSGPDGKPQLDTQGRPRLMYRKVIGDLGNTPAKPKIQDVSKIDGIFWIDDKAESVAALAKALGIPTPPLFACFFSADVEKALRKLEKEKFKGDEMKIEETHFQVVKADNGPYKGKTSRYKLVCHKVMLRDEQNNK
jgi:hypothetical protein